MPHNTVRLAKLLRPQTSPWMVLRTRLETLIDQATERPLTLVCAPAGFGKTSLLSQWAARRRVGTAWLSLDDSDSNLRQFVHSLVSAVRTVDGRVGHDTLTFARLGNQATATQFAVSFTDDLLSLDHHVTVILDDYHVIDDPEVHTFVRGVLQFPPPMLHLMVATRSDPPIPLAVLRAHGRMIEVRSDELRFTLDETRAFLRQATGSDPEDRVLGELHGLSEGWIAALHLAALTAGSRPDAFPRQDTIDSVHRSAVDFLVHQVMNRQPEPIQAFLARIALPRQITANLAGVLTEDVASDPPTADVLERMEHAGLFLFPLGEDHHWYRFHPLFRALLLQRLEDAIGESGINALHLKASRWFEESGNIDEAMTHALAAGDATRAASILARQLQKTLVLGRWQDLERWLKVLPAEVIDSDVDILLARCWMNQSRGRYDVVRMLINRTSAILAVREENDAVAWTAMYRAELAVLGAFVGDTGPGSASALECAAIAYQALDGSGRFAEMFAIHVYGSKLGLSDRQQANCFLNQIVATNAIERDMASSWRILWARATQIMLARHDGEPQRVAYLAETLLRSAKRDHAPRLAAMGHFWVGLTNFEMNRVQEAEGHFRSALAEPASGMIVALNAATLLALSLNAQGFRDEADVVIDTMMDQLLDHEVTGSVAYLRVVMAHLALARGDLGTAAFEVRALPAELDIKSFGWIDLPAVTIATVWVMERTPDRLEAAATLLAEMQEQAEALNLHQPQVQIALVQGLLHRVSGQDREAGECLDKALAMAAGAGYIRTFMDLGPAIRPLLEWHAQHNCKSLYLERLLEHFGTLRPPRTISPLRDRDVLRHHLMATFPVGEFESLTERELDVLLGLQRRLSNKEIADELSISPLTIKTHTRNIYGKLGVNSRRQAIARAMDLGLLA